MPWFLKGNCVWSGTKESPGEEVKCHEDHEKAVAHMRALYANVEDAGKAVTVEMDGVVVEVKGGRGSGWHNPPEGTHTAENAPNFAGGPGADRKFGTESDEAPEGQKLCKCTKCGSTFTLPKGKQCEDVPCPGCGGGATQTSPRKDPKAEGEGGRGGGGGKKALSPSGTGNVHGEESMLGEVASVMGEDAECKCPHCKKGVPCSAKACPHCKEKIDKVERGESDKRATKSEGDGDHPASHYLVVEDPEKPTTWRLRVRGTDGELDHGLMGGAWAALHGGYRGNKYEGPNKEMALAKLKRFYKQEGMDTPSEQKWVSYKSADGAWRWLSIVNWAVVDKEAELITEQAYRDAITYAEKTSNYGELDEIHVDGTDVGDCDTLFILKGGNEPAKLCAGGTWRDTEKATLAREAIQAESSYWGMSLKFRFDPKRKFRGVYTRSIQALKHTILPQSMAASWGTAIAVQGGNQMAKELDEKTRAALAKLGHSEEEIEALAEKNKALPTEESVVEKEETTEAIPGRETLWAQLGKALGIGAKEVVPEASLPDEARKADEEDPVPATKQAAEAEQPDASALMQALGETVAKSVGEMVKKELDVRDERISELETLVKALGEPIEEKVEQRLRDMPPIAKVAASSVVAPAADGKAGFTFGRQPANQNDFLPTLMKSISEAVEDTMGSAKFQA
jgi:hypothetical protein